jgi:hypothetical protein
MNIDTLRRLNSKASYIGDVGRGYTLSVAMQRRSDITPIHYMFSEVQGQSGACGLQ